MAHSPPGSPSRFSMETIGSGLSSSITGRLFGATSPDSSPSSKNKNSDPYSNYNYDTYGVGIGRPGSSEGVGMTSTPSNARNRGESVTSGESKGSGGEGRGIGIKRLVERIGSAGHSNPGREDVDELGRADPTSPHYDPYFDPEHQLRVTRSATASIHESIREEDRRRLWRRKTSKLGESFRSRSRSRSFFKGRRRATGNSKRPRTGDGTIAEEDEGDLPMSPPLDGRYQAENEGLEEEFVIGPAIGGMTDVERQRHRMDYEEEERRRRMDVQDSSQCRSQMREKTKLRRQSVIPGQLGAFVAGTEAKNDGRRNVYVNVERERWLPGETDPNTGQPRAVYSRNKVRTSKYTALSFFPKNLMEQFRRVANIYFLVLVVLQVFPIFGAAAPQVAALPLIFILALTGLKDGVEDWRRHTLDNQVNNSPATRLGNWKNINQPEIWGNWFERLFGLGQATRGKTASKGVRKLREQDNKQGGFSTDFLSQDQPMRSSVSSSVYGGNGGMIHSDSSHTIAPRQPVTYGKDDSPEDAAAEVLSDEGLGASGSTLRTTYPPEPSLGSLNKPPPAVHGRGRSHTLESGNAPSYATHRSDVVDYRKPASGMAKWERTLWKKLEVGDVVLLREDEQIPADIVVLNTSDADGTCYVETKNLDGETNLKPRRSTKGTMGIASEEDVEHAQFWIDSEPPNANLYSYNAVLRYHVAGEPKEEPVGINEMLLRGCALRNTRWVIGLVVFTGADTKIMLNQGETPSKRSKIEKETNFNVLANFVILIAICAVCGVAQAFFLAKDNTSSDSYEIDEQLTAFKWLDGVVTFGAALILFQNIVPISLVITVELVKTIQAYFIHQDVDMYYEPIDYPCVPKTWNISDDLGQIEYVFSDKTGTLTQNVMEFKKCSINGVAYGEGVTEAQLGSIRREGHGDLNLGQLEAQLEESKANMVVELGRHFQNRYFQESKLTLISPSLAENLDYDAPDHEAVVEFFQALAVCHTVIADRPDPDNPSIVEYKAESPDEAALVSAARDMGFAFLSRTSTELQIQSRGEVMTYIPLRILEFNSTRKRMSMVVKTPQNRILLICKGADSVIYQRLREDHDPELKESTRRDLEAFANGGLRTLCLAYKYLTEQEFAMWARTYDAACSATTDREEEIEKACEFVEHGFTLLGATALEDKLQAGVPETIKQLHEGGLKLWILTGDKLQTAIEIGFSCNLLTNDMDVLILSAETESGARSQIEAALDKVNAAKSGVVGSMEKDGTEKADSFAVVIDGETLRFALDAALKPTFLDLATQCSAVICCRVSPSQKALTVKLVKEGKNAMTLAIGDGANDVAMIQEAHVGVGIAGLEGAQASMSADYAVGQFRYLSKLLLVHGRWSYIRIADMHVAFFFKNIIWTFTLFWYQIWCSFDSTYLYDYSLIMLYNLVFTSLPCGLLGAFDQDLGPRAALANPQLYRRGVLGLEYGQVKFWMAIFDGFYQSLVAYFVPYFIFQNSTSVNGNGLDFSRLEFGTTVACGAVICANAFVGLLMRSWTWLFSVVTIVSSILPVVWIAVYSELPLSGTFRHLVEYLYSSINFWGSILFVQVAALLPRYLYIYVSSQYFPKDNDIIRERVVYGLEEQPVYDVEKTAHEKDIIETPPPPMQERTPRKSPIGRRQSLVHPDIHETPAATAIPMISAVSPPIEDSSPPISSFQSAQGSPHPLSNNSPAIDEFGSASGYLPSPHSTHNGSAVSRGPSYASSYNSYNTARDLSWANPEYEMGVAR